MGESIPRQHKRSLTTPCRSNSESEIYGITSFHVHFQFKRQSKYIIKMPQDTTCHLQGDQHFSKGDEGN